MAHPYLMHGMLAVSATHLKHLSPGHPEHDLAESYHWQRSLKLLREELQFKLGTHNMDPVLSTSMLLGKLLPLDDGWWNQAHCALCSHGVFLS